MLFRIFLICKIFIKKVLLNNCFYELYAVQVCILTQWMVLTFNFRFVAMLISTNFTPQFYL